mgnify:CR=1 FL=1
MAVPPRATIPTATPPTATIPMATPPYAITPQATPPKARARPNEQPPRLNRPRAIPPTATIPRAIPPIATTPVAMSPQQRFPERDRESLLSSNQVPWQRGTEAIRQSRFWTGCECLSECRSSSTPANSANEPAGNANVSIRFTRKNQHHSSRLSLLASPKASPTVTIPVA